MLCLQSRLTPTILIVVATLAVFSGCGGGDNNASSTTNPEQPNDPNNVGPNEEDPSDPGKKDGGTNDGSPDAAEPLSTSVETVCSSGDWCWSYPRITGDDFTQITGTSDTDMWLLASHPVHFDGKKLRTFDGILSSVRIGAIASVSPTEAWAFSAEFGGAYRWDGVKWNQVNLLVSQNQPSEARVIGSTIVLAGAQVASKKGADPWKQETTGLQGYGPALAVAGTSDNDIWVAAKSRVAHWNGAAWTATPVTNIDIASIEAIPNGAGSELWLAGKTPGVDGFAAVARPNAAASGWDVTPTMVQHQSFESIRARANGDVWATAYGVTGHFVSGAWSFQPATELMSIRSLFRAPSGAFYATGRHGRIKRSDKPGASFTWLAGKEDTNDFWLDNIWGSSAADVWAVGQRYEGFSSSSPLLLHFNGTAWSETAPPAGAPKRLLEIRGSSATNVWAAGDTGLLRFDGTNWSVASSPPGVTKGLIHVHPRAVNDVWAFELAYHACRLHHFDGASWTATAANPDCEHGAIGTAMWAFSNEVWFSGRNVRVNGGSGNGLVRWNGATWSFPSIVGNSETNFFALDETRAWLADSGLKKRNAATGGWTKVEGVPNRVDAVFAFAENDVWTMNFTSVHRFDGVTWSEQPMFRSIQPLNLGPRALYGANPNDMWMAYRGGLLRRKK